MGPLKRNELSESASGSVEEDAPRATESSGDLFGSAEKVRDGFWSRFEQFNAKTSQLRVSGGRCGSSSPLACSGMLAQPLAAQI